jgi:hypothetical protein
MDQKQNSSAHRRPKGRKGRAKGRRAPRLDIANGTSSPFGSLSRYVCLRKPCIVKVPKFLQLFPDEYEAWGRTSVLTTLTGSLAFSYGFKSNGVYNLFGPQVNWTGAFSANVPAGSKYLINNPAAGGSAAPYNVSTVLEQDICAEFSSYGSTVTAACGVALLPTDTNSLSGSAFSQIREMRGCSSLLLPAVINAPLTVRNKFTIADQFGVPEREIRENPSFSQVPGTDPVALGYFVLYLSSLDGSTNVSVDLVLTINTRYLFRRLNPFNTTVPT